MPKDFRGGSTIEEIEARKKQALEDIRKMEAEIERLKAEEEQKRKIDLIGLYSRMESLIKTCSSSMSDNSIGEIREIDFNSDEGIAEAYMRTIDVEISGRYRDDHDTVTRCGIDQLARPRRTDDPTLVVSFLIPFDLIEDDPFFKQRLTWIFHAGTMGTMTPREASEHLPISESFLKLIGGDRDYDMTEVVALRSELALDKLELMNRFYDYNQTRYELTDNMIRELEAL